MPRTLLSLAIRQGAWMRPQAFDYLYTRVGHGWGSCALGAGLEYFFGFPGFVYLEYQQKNIALLEEYTGVSLEQYVLCPVEKREYKLITILLRLNDIYRWSREEIAAWLESIEL